MKVYLLPKKRASFAISLAIPFGSADREYIDARGERHDVPEGAAHLLEHRMFYPEDGTDVMTRFSALGADANAATSYRCTSFFCSGTSHFSECLRTLLFCMTHPRFTEEGLAGECRIVSEEIRMYADCPGDVCYQQMLGALYENHPVRDEICGSEAGIAAITPAQLLALWQSFYRPSEMILTVSGNVSLPRVMRVLDECLPPNARVPAVKKITPKEPDGVRCHRVECRREVAHPQFSIGFKDAPPPADPVERMRRYATMAILDDLLFSFAGEFYQGLLERGLLNPCYSYENTQEDDFAFHTVSGESDDPDAVLGALDAYLIDVRARGLDRAAFERCRRVLYAGYVRGFDDPEEIADNLLNFALDAYPVFDYPALLASITAEEAETLLETAFLPENRVLSVVYPPAHDPDKDKKEE